MSRDLIQDTNVSLGKEIMLSTSRFGIYANVDNIWYVEYTVSEISQKATL